MIRARLRRWALLPAALAIVSCVAGAAGAAEAASRVLVLPLRALGVSDTTMLVSQDLLAGSLEDLGVPVVRPAAGGAPLPSGADACGVAECAAALAREHGAEQVVYGSLSRLGGKIIARLNVLRTGETEPWYRDQLTAASEDDLDRVMRRFAEGIAAGRPNSDRATVESVTRAETETPARRATRSGVGVRAGFLFPDGNSFGGADRLTNLRAVYRYEFKEFQIETTPVLGFTWGKSNFDWSLLDVGASRIFGTGDVSGYLGGSIGVHSVTVASRRWYTYEYPGYPPYTYENTVRHTDTVPTLDLVAGLMALRTYDFVVVVELRYHHVFESFERAGGGGAHGFLLTFGTSH